MSAIGLMLGCYVLVRMLELITASGERAPHPYVRLAAMVAAAVTTVALLGIVLVATSLR